MGRPKRATRRNIEIEIKIPCENIDQLQQLSANIVLETPRHFEDNWMLDTVDGRLKNEHSALRIRFIDGRGLITFKGLSSTGSRFKAREELETHTDEPEQMLAIFERLGYQPFFRYQKYRTVYKITFDNEKTLKAMFDETPIGNFLELEGTEEAVIQAVSALGLLPKDYITSTYIGMQAERCRVAGRPLEDLVFQDLVAGD
ncbi:MAG: class IV adenylate cyclase [Acidobacteriota bacterium]